MTRGSERIHVTVDGQVFSLIPGSTVADVTALLTGGERYALESGAAKVIDLRGYEVGSGGALFDGMALFLAPAGSVTSSPPPSP